MRATFETVSNYERVTFIRFVREWTENVCTSTYSLKIDYYLRIMENTGFRVSEQWRNSGVRFGFDSSFHSGIVIGTAVAVTNSYRMMYCDGACSRNKVARYKRNNRRKELWEHARALVQPRRKKKRTRTCVWRGISRK